MYQSSRALQHLHPSLQPDHAAKGSKGSLATCLVLSSASGFCPLPVPGPSLRLLARSPTRQTPPPPPQIQFIFCQIHFLMVSQIQSAQQKAGGLKPSEGEAGKNVCPSQAAANSAPAPPCKPAPGLHLYRYIQLALLQPRGQGSWATLFIFSQKCLYPTCPVLSLLLQGNIWKNTRSHRPQPCWGHAEKQHAQTQNKH